MDAIITAHQPLIAPVHTIAELKEAANQKMTKMCREYINDGAMELLTLRDNEEAYNRYKILPRVLVNVKNIDCSGEIFGCKTGFPLGFAPAAMHSLAHEDGELATSRAAASFGIAMAVSMYATTSIEDVAAQGTGNPYIVHIAGLRDLANAEQLLRRAERAGCAAVFLSVDTPQVGRRLNEQRNHFLPPRGTAWPNDVPSGDDSPPEFGEAGEAPGARAMDPSLEWNTAIPWLRQHTKIPVWIKGVGTAEDVKLAIEYGVDGVVVSNHGGRQLDGCPSTLDMLRECATAAGNRIPVAVDGGIRRGTDIFKAIAMGAKHCFVGRIPFWGLAFNGEDGVKLALAILMQEFKLAMALAGCRTVGDIKRRYITYLDGTGALTKL